MLTSLLIIWLSIVFDPLHYSQINQMSERLHVLGLALILPTFFLIASIGRLAKFRFFSPEDIDGGGIMSGTNQANVLQTLLQNTLEQLVGRSRYRGEKSRLRRRKSVTSFPLILRTG